MKDNRIVHKLLFYTFLLLFCACKKEAGPGGKNTILGTIEYKNAITGGNSAAAGATIYIYYDTNAADSEYDQAILTDARGKYEIKALYKGKYFMKAIYRDVNGFYYNTPGYAIELKNKKNSLEINMILE